MLSSTRAIRPLSLQNSPYQLVHGDNPDQFFLKFQKTGQMMAAHSEPGLDIPFHLLTPRAIHSGPGMDDEPDLKSVVLAHDDKSFLIRVAGRQPSRSLRRTSGVTGRAD
jgi:hypothetical protein